MFIVLTVAMALFTSTMASTARQRVSKRESILASEEMRRVLEVMRDEQFSQLFVRYNDSGADDPGGPGTAPGRHFSVRGLTPRPNDPDGFVGEIIMPEQGGQLREDMTLVALGMPRDLDADGVIDSADHFNDYVLLPVHIRVQWRGHGGDRELEMYTLFADL